MPVLLTPVLLMPVDDAENLRCNVFHRPIRIDRHQSPLHPVIIRYRLGLMLIGRQALRDNFSAIVVANHQLGSVQIAQLIDERWLQVNVIEIGRASCRERV